MVNEEDQGKSFRDAVSISAHQCKKYAWFWPIMPRIVFQSNELLRKVLVLHERYHREKVRTNFKFHFLHNRSCLEKWRRPLCRRGDFPLLKKWHPHIFWHKLNAKPPPPPPSCQNFVLTRIFVFVLSTEGRLGWVTVYECKNATHLRVSRPMSFSHLPAMPPEAAYTNEYGSCRWSNLKFSH